MERLFLKEPYEVEQWFQQSNSDVYSMDWETTGLNYLKMEPVGISFADNERSCYIDLWLNGDQEDIFNLLSVIFQTGTFIAHNAKFDLKCCNKFVGYSPSNLFCTYIASFLLNENRGSHSLDSLAMEYFGIGKCGKWEDYNDWHTEEFYEYAIRDAELTYKLYEVFAPKLQEEELEHVFKIEMDFIPVAAEIEMNGVLVDKKALNALQRLVESKILACEDEMLGLVNKRPNIQNGIFNQEIRTCPVNFNSPDQLVECFNKLGLEIKDKTPGGKPSVAKATLESLKGEPFVDALTEYKKLRKLYTAYILPCWEMIDEDGRIRPDLGIVKTGRTSMSRPNLQQLPNVRDKSINYRSIFGTNGTLIGADWSGQELRILGEITQDETISRSFRDGHDLHLVTANHIFHLGLDKDSLTSGSEVHTRAVKQYHTERYKAKNGANFPIVYGSTAAGIAWRQGVSKDEAQKWVDGFFKAYPRVKTAMDEIPSILYTHGFVSTLMGRRRRFPYYQSLPQFSRHKQPSKDRCVRQAFNFLIQGFAADQAKIAGRKILDQLKEHPEWKARILLLVHDEYCLEVLEEKYVPQVSECVKNCMENAVCLSVPFTVDCKIGKNYSEIK